MGVLVWGDFDVCGIDSGFSGGQMVQTAQSEENFSGTQGNGMAAENGSLDAVSSAGLCQRISVADGLCRGDSGETLSRNP